MLFKHLCAAKLCQNPFPALDLSLSSPTLFKCPGHTVSKMLCTSSEAYMSLFLIFALSPLLKQSTHPSKSTSYVTVSMSSSPILPGRVNYHSIFVHNSGMIPIMLYQSCLHSFHFYFTTRLLPFLPTTHFDPSHPDLENHEFEDK